MILLVAALAAAVSSPPLGEAERALAAGRPDQARQMIASAIASGASGPQVDRLLADLAFATGDWPRALAQYEALLATAPNDPVAIENAGIAALRAGKLARAVTLLDRATTRPEASWRAWNARGVAADGQRDWAVADRAYDRAATLAPGNYKVLNNRGWSLLLRGEWAAAVPPLAEAATLAPADSRVAANLDLAQSGVADSLPARRANESGQAYAARLNDAGVAAVRLGDRSRAVAAFVQALEASDRWFAHAANNLALVEAAR